MYIISLNKLIRTYPSILERLVCWVSTRDSGRGSELHFRLLYVLREMIWSPTATLSRYPRDRDMVVMMTKCLCFTCLRCIVPHHITQIRHCPYLQLRFLYIFGEPLVRFHGRLHSSDHRLPRFDLCNGFGCLSQRLWEFDANSRLRWVVRRRFGGDAANRSDRTRYCSEDLLTHSIFLLLLLVLCHQA